MSAVSVPRDPKGRAVVLRAVGAQWFGALVTVVVRDASGRRELVGTMLGYGPTSSGTTRDVIALGYAQGRVYAVSAATVRTITLGDES